MELENVSLNDILSLRITNYSYSVPNSENLRQPIEMQLSKKQKSFSEFLASFPKFASIFEQF